MKNKKGTDKIISMYWFVILFLVAAAIVYMAAIFYGEPYDVREIEAHILANQIANCVAEGGYLKENILFDEEFKNNFLEQCDLNFNVEDVYGWKELEQYYLKIEFYTFDPNMQDNLGDLKFDFFEGNINLKDDCDRMGRNFPICVERSFYTLGKDNQKYAVKILSIVRKTEKNVR
ncbi:hypothetical protein KAR52_02765 [Candidatus Pacearchaeota archaeon]|nr:hypothetical protein [Candidatus Pacearchaeota archaeon]